MEKYINFEEYVQGVLETGDIGYKYDSLIQYREIRNTTYVLFKDKKLNQTKQSIMVQYINYFADETEDMFFEFFHDFMETVILENVIKKAEENSLLSYLSKHIRGKFTEVLDKKFGEVNKDEVTKEIKGREFSYISKDEVIGKDEDDNEITFEDIGLYQQEKSKYTNKWKPFIKYLELTNFKGELSPFQAEVYDGYLKYINQFREQNGLMPASNDFNMVKIANIINIISDKADKKERNKASARVKQAVDGIRKKLIRTHTYYIENFKRPELPLSHIVTSVLNHISYPRTYSSEEDVFQLIQEQIHQYTDVDTDDKKEYLYKKFKHNYFESKQIATMLEDVNTYTEFTNFLLDSFPTKAKSKIVNYAISGNFEANEKLKPSQKKDFNAKFIKILEEYEQRSDKKKEALVKSLENIRQNNG